MFNLKRGFVNNLETYSFYTYRKKKLEFANTKRIGKFKNLRCIINTSIVLALNVTE